jgi:hypothetical protein
MEAYGVVRRRGSYSLDSRLTASTIKDIQYRSDKRFVGEAHIIVCKTWGFHGGDYEEWCLLGCYAVWLL